jgi:hypothetical protein
MVVRVFGSADDYTVPDAPAWAPVQVSAFRPRWPAPFGYARELKRALAAFAPDLTHTHGVWQYGVYMILLPPRSGC